jgi:hypothetical protein
MLISALSNVKQAIGNLLIEPKGDAHQIWHKPTQQKNRMAEKMFLGIYPRPIGPTYALGP